MSDNLSEPQIILKDLILKRDGFTLLANGVFEKGVHLITGKIGCGKTTLSMALAGYLRQESGLIECKNIEKTLLSMQFPEYHLTGLTLEDEIKSWGLFSDEILDKSELCGYGKTDPMKMSRGELKRLHLVCILSKRKDLLILDEPFSTLSPMWKERFCNNLAIQEGITIIFTHEQTYFPKTDYIWDIDSGELNYIGHVPECLDSWKSAPEYIKTALKKGVLPKNIRFEDTLEAICRMQD